MSSPRATTSSTGRRSTWPSPAAMPSWSPMTAAVSRPTRSSPTRRRRHRRPPLPSGRLEKVEAFGNVSVRTTVDTVTGDRAVYVPDSGIARVGGRVRITRGQNQLAGSEAEVNLKTNVSRLLAGNTGRVQGLVVPNDSTNQQLVGPAPATAPGTGA